MVAGKKIIFVVTKSNWGGAQRYVYDLAARLPERFEVLAVAGGNGPLLDKLKEAGIRAICLPELERDIRFFKEFAALRRLIRIFCEERPDIVHLNSSKIGGLGAVAARLASLTAGRKPLVIFTAHGWAFNEERPWLERQWFRLLYSASAIFQNRVIAVSEAVFADGRRLPFVKKKLVLVKNGAMPHSLIDRDAARKFIRGRLGRIGPDAPWLGVVAELTGNKGVEYAIRAMADPACPASILVIIGAGELETELKTLAANLGLADRVFFAGFVAEAGRYIKAFDIMIVPSVTDALPYVLVEAGQAGVPVIASKVGGIPEMAEHQKSALLVAPREPRAIAGAAARLLAEPGLGERLSKGLREKVMRQFGFGRMLEETVRLYEAD